MKPTREAILLAVAECDRLGEAAFLAAHGYRPSLRYKLHVAGREYPSKAILGVALGKSAREFSGGAAHTVRALAALGFEVVAK